MRAIAPRVAIRGQVARPPAAFGSSRTRRARTAGQPLADVPGRHRADDGGELVAVAGRRQAEGAERPEQEEPERAGPPAQVIDGSCPSLGAGLRRLRRPVRSVADLRPGEPDEGHEEAHGAEDHGQEVEAKRQVTVARTGDEVGDRRQLGDRPLEDRVAHRPGEFERVESPGQAVGVGEAGQAGEGRASQGRPPPAATLGVEGPAPERGVDQGEADQDRAEDEQPLRVHPRSLDDRQGEREPGTLAPSAEDRQVGGQVKEGQGLGADVHPAAQDEQGRQPGQEHRPDRPVAAPGRDQERDGQGRDPALDQVEPDQAEPGVADAREDLEDPVEVDPGPVRRPEREGVQGRHPPRGPDLVARLEVIPEVVILVAEDPQQEHQRQEAGDQPDIGEPVRPRAGFGTGRSGLAGGPGVGLGAEGGFGRAHDPPESRLSRSYVSSQARALGRSASATQTRGPEAMPPSESLRSWVSAVAGMPRSCS